MTQREDSPLLRDILDYAGRAKVASTGRSRADLDDDPVLAAALERFVEVIGEAPSRLSEEMRDANPQVRWREIIALRNRLVHGYFAVDHDILWNIVQDDIPELINALANILDQQEELRRSDG